MSRPRTLFDRIWERRVALPPGDDHPAIIRVDTHLIHEVTSPQAFALLRERGLRVRRPDRTFATTDHSTPTRFRKGKPVWFDRATELQVATLRKHCEEHGIPLFPLGDRRQGIVHVIGPELGLTRPGDVIVCGDSHTSTHGAFGAWAFGIGATEVAQVLATQRLLQERPQTFAVEVSGRLAPGVTAKDLALGIIRRIGVDGGRGHVIEYRGEAVRALGMEGRMTLCNMSIEAGARAGMIGPDETTFKWMEGREYAPAAGEAWDSAVAGWRALATDGDAVFDRTAALDVSALQPMVTWGTNPGMSCGVREATPAPTTPEARAALDYMGIEPETPLAGRPVDVVFIGSCTNSRLPDLRAAAGILRGRKTHPGVRVLVVPGSAAVRDQARREGLDEAFRGAGAEWREPGCSMCIAMNGDRLAPGQLAISTSNRNFEGRQGPGGRTILASPLTAAASAVRGAVADPREFA